MHDTGVMVIAIDACPCAIALHRGERLYAIISLIVSKAMTILYHNILGYAIIYGSIVFLFMQPYNHA